MAVVVIQLLQKRREASRRQPVIHYGENSALPRNDGKRVQQRLFMYGTYHPLIDVQRSGLVAGTAFPQFPAISEQDIALVFAVLGQNRIQLFDSGKGVSGQCQALAAVNVYRCTSRPGRFSREAAFLILKKISVIFLLWEIDGDDRPNPQGRIHIHTTLFAEIEQQPGINIVQADPVMG